MKTHFIYLFSSLALLLLVESCMKTSITNEKLNLTDNWKIQQSSKVSKTGKELTSSDFSSQDWYPAKIPATVMGILYDNGLYPNIMNGLNMKEIDRTPFDSSWWFLNEFDLPALQSGQQVSLEFKGLGYRANIWLNGELIANSDEVFGPFRQFMFNITPYIKEKNCLAVEIFRAQAGDPNIGFVDWNPRPADESMGIFREVFVHISGDVKMENTAVKSKVNTETLKEAWLTVETQLTNYSAKTIKGKLKGKIEDVVFTYPVELAANETKVVTITSDDVADLQIENPRLWWCNNLGNPEMYTLDLEFECGNNLSDKETVRFGIRELKDYFTEDNFRGFILNGQNVLIKSAGWTDDIFLRDTDESNEIQVKYVKDMNLNSIRFENIWGKSHNIYNLCDEYGLLALVGWSCQWEWDSYLGSPTDNYGGIITEEQMDVVAKSFHDQILWLRNHPSIIAWYVGSDMIPRPALEKRYMEILDKLDDRPYVASAARDKSEITGPTGMKMAGPYEYVGPNYWYEDRKYGGAYGFNTETGIGSQLPVIESIKKFIPEDKLWPVGEYWDFHCTTSTTEMNSMRILNKVMNEKYGEAKSLEEYVRKGHVIDYEGTRAMFEAFRCHIPNTTGIVQWMLNSAWPSIYWQVYDYYLIPTAGYYGVKKANQPQQLIYNYAENSVYAVNENIHETLTGKAIVKIYALNSKILFEKEVDLNVPVNTAASILELPIINENVFLALEIQKDDKGIVDNFYWLSSDKDIFDWDKTYWVNTPTLKYANQKALNNLSTAKLDVSMKLAEPGEYTVELKNETNQMAFFIQLLIKDESGEILFPVEWSDNYVSVLPNGNKILKFKACPELLKDKKLSMQISAWNVESMILEI